MWTPGGLLFEYNFNTVSNMNRLVKKLAEESQMHCGLCLAG